MDEGDSLALLGRNGMGKTTLLVTLMDDALCIAGRSRVARCGSRGASHVSAQPVGPRLGAAGAVHVLVTHRRGASHGSGAARSLERGARVRDLPAPLRAPAATTATSSAAMQMLAIARALMVNPRLLLLDELMEGLAPIIVQELMTIIHGLVAEGGMAVIVVEQHAKLALSLTRQAIVLERGRVVHRAASATLPRTGNLASPAAVRHDVLPRSGLEHPRSAFEVIDPYVDALSPAQTVLVLAAMRDVAAAGGRHALSAADDRAALAAFHRFVLRATTPLAVDLLPTCTPSMLAAAVPKAADRVHVAQFLVVMALVDGTIDAARIAVVAYASARR